MTESRGKYTVPPRLPKRQSDAVRKTTEKDFRQLVVDFARLHGWLVYFTWKSIHSPAGFPDCVFVRQTEEPKQLSTVALGLGNGRVVQDSTQPRLIIAELKVGKNQPTAEQCEWLEAMHMAGVPSYLWYPTPECWDEIQRVLGRGRGVGDGR